MIFFLFDLARRASSVSCCNPVCGIFTVNYTETVQPTLVKWSAAQSFVLLTAVRIPSLWFGHVHRETSWRSNQVIGAGTHEELGDALARLSRLSPLRLRLHLFGSIDSELIKKFLVYSAATRFRVMAGLFAFFDCVTLPIICC